MLKQLRIWRRSQLMTNFLFFTVSLNRQLLEIMLKMVSRIINNQLISVQCTCMSRPRHIWWQLTYLSIILIQLTCTMHERVFLITVFVPPWHLTHPQRQVINLHPGLCPPLFWIPKIDVSIDPFIDNFKLIIQNYYFFTRSLRYLRKGVNFRESIF